MLSECDKENLRVDVKPQVSKCVVVLRQRVNLSGCVSDARSKVRCCHLKTYNSGAEEQDSSPAPPQLLSLNHLSTPMFISSLLLDQISSISCCGLSWKGCT